MKEVPVLMVDNMNPFCSRTMQLIFNGGGYNKFNFLSIHCDESRKILSQHGIEITGEKLVVLYEKGKIYLKSGALLHASRKLDGLTSLLYGFIIIPKKIRDLMYDRLSETDADK